MNGPRLPRRELLAKAIWGTAAAGAAGTVGVLAAPRVAMATSGRTVAYDVACLLNTFTPIIADASTDPTSNFRGTTFFVEGELYPEGTIPNGVTDFDPASATPIGHWLCRGWFINRTDRPGETDRPEPHVLTHQEYLLSRITDDNVFPLDQLASSGLEGDSAGRSAPRSVVGGAGAWHGASGTVTQHVIGVNITAGPNFRFEFDLAKHGS